MPELIVKLGDNIVQKYFFVRETMRIGRSPENEIVIENLAVSRNHAQITWDDGRYLLTDLGSSNGTYVNGVRIRKTEIMDKDVITIGKHKLYFYDLRAGEAPARPAPLSVDSTMLVTGAAEPEVEPQAELVVTKGRQRGQVFVLHGPVATLGRGTANDVRIHDWFVSKQHARIERRGADFYLTDLGSWRHTMVNGSVIETIRLQDGDVIQLGTTVELTFRCIRPEVDQAPLVRRPVELAAGRDAEPPAPHAAATDGAPRTQMIPMADVFGAPPPDAQPAADPAPPEDPSDVLPGTSDETPPNDATPHAAAVETPSVEPQAAEVPAEPEAPFLLAAGTAPPDPVEDLVASMARVSVRGAVESAAAAHAELELRAESEDARASGACDEQAAASDAPASPAEAERAAEIALWERALQNKNPLIRKQAARRLKQLTGRDYPY